MGGQNKQRKIKLWERDPHCHWCGRLTKLVYQQPSEPADPLMATVDHLRTKYDPTRWLAHDGLEERTVLACYECNNNRAAQDNRSRSRDDLQRRGKGFKLNPGLFSGGNNPQTVEQVLEGLESFHRIPVDKLVHRDKVMA